MSTDHVHNFDINKTMDVIREIVEDVLSTHRFNVESIDHWSRRIVDLCQQSLYEKQTSLKTIVTTMIIPKNEDIVHMSNACLWDFTIDGSTIIQWENDSMYCVVSAFVLPGTLFNSSSNST